MERNKIEALQRMRDDSLSQMSKEEFQRLAEKYLGNGRIRLEPWYYVGKKVTGEIMREEGVLYYVQSLSARGVAYDLNGLAVSADLRIGIEIAGEQYFLSDPAYYLIVNDFAVDAITVQNMPWSGGGVKLDENKIYCVGWKAYRW